MEKPKQLLVFCGIKFNFRANALELKLSHCDVFNTILNRNFNASHPLWCRVSIFHLKVGVVCQKLMQSQRILGDVIHN